MNHTDRFEETVPLSRALACAEAAVVAESPPDEPVLPQPQQVAMATCEEHATVYPTQIFQFGQLRPNACPKCVLERTEAEARRGARAANQQRVASNAAKVREAMEAKFKRSLIPSRFAEYTLDTFPPPRPGADDYAAKAAALAACRSYVNTFDARGRRGANLVLIGPPGTGKTGLACGVGNQLMRVGPATVLYMHAYDVVRHQRDTWGRRGDTEAEAWKQLIDPDLLILDEVGVQVGTDTELLLLFRVIDGRYAERKPVVIVSNLPVEDFYANNVERPGLKNFLGQRAWDRLQDDGSVVVPCQWPSLRGRP